MIGIYFLLKKGRIVYIGQSKNIKQRIISHKGLKNFDSYRFIICEKSKLLHYEKRLIKYFIPILNSDNYGGARPNSGRPIKEPTKVIRVPVSKLQAIAALLKK